MRADDKDGGRKREESEWRDKAAREAGFKLHHLFPGVSARMISSVHCNQLP